MGILSIVLIVVWISLIFEGAYGFVKGHFPKEENKIKKHEPNAYKKWVKISSVLLIICSVINIILSVLDLFSDADDWKFVIFICVSVAVCIVIISIVYCNLVKPADKKAGIESEFTKILKDNK